VRILVVGSLLALAFAIRGPRGRILLLTTGVAAVFLAISLMVARFWPGGLPPAWASGGRQAAVLELLKPRFGYNLGGENVTNFGKHILRVEHQFNLDAGFTNKDDRLPEFFNTEPVAPHNAVWDFSGAEIDEFWNF